MDSITKSKLTYEQIDDMVKQAFGNAAKSEIITELKDGYFNTAYMLKLTDGLKTVLKVSPPKDLKVMRYEKNIMEAEVYTLNKISSLGSIPVPKVFYYDSSREMVENEFFFMEFIAGVPLNKMRPQLTEEQFIEISSELGSFVKQIHSIEGSHFGYISQEDKRFNTWSEAFLFMINELLEDAKDAKVALPYGCDKIYNIVFKKRNVLNSVRIPSLIHKDLWEGNIFIDPKTAKITGIIDCERSIYGDTLLEPVCGSLLQNKSFMNSYDGRDSLEKEEEIRALLYRLYLYLIMVIECSYRLYSDDNYFKWARAKLDEVIAELLKLGK